jgi:hypothetical protein
MTTLQRAFEEEANSIGAGTAMPSEHLYLNLGENPVLGDGIPAISSIFLDKDVESHNNCSTPSRESPGLKSEIIVKVEEDESNASTSASSIREKIT